LPPCFFRIPGRASVHVWARVPCIPFWNCSTCGRCLWRERYKRLGAAKLAAGAGIPGVRFRLVSSVCTSAGRKPGAARQRLSAAVALKGNYGRVAPRSGAAVLHLLAQHAERRFSPRRPPHRSDPPPTALSRCRILCALAFCSALRADRRGPRFRYEKPSSAITRHLRPLPPLRRFISRTSARRGRSPSSCHPQAWPQEQGVPHQLAHLLPFVWSAQGDGLETRNALLPRTRTTGSQMELAQINSSGWAQRGRAASAAEERSSSAKNPHFPDLQPSLGHFTRKTRRRCRALAPRHFTNSSSFTRLSRLPQMLWPRARAEMGRTEAAMLHFHGPR